ncbi:glutaredoxin [Propionibacteriaceae bacterium G1746]|uniref:glutaredoxin n=1 Tax=Aestuariimicrobium sp. G57 TaxID=3418485 RepID=UPI003C185308
MTSSQPVDPFHRTIPDLPHVVLVTTTACHFCDAAHEELFARQARGQITLEVLPATSPRGQQLLAQHRPAMFPLTLVDGQFFSAGRLPVRRLDRAIPERQGA